MDTRVSMWHPAWWTDKVHGSAWERVKEAMRRDWMETTHDLGIGGHELNQGLLDTVRQVVGTEHLPTLEEANPPRVIGEWSEAEIPYGYGHAARTQFGTQHAHWNEELEEILKGEWTSAQDDRRRHWGTVRSFVRRGYEYDESEDQDIEDSLSAPAPAGV
jgi:hypothetical protein